MSIIEFKNASKSYGEHLVLDDVSFEVHQNEKVGLLGKNGTGKTTLFNMIANRCDYEGEVHIQKGFSLAYLEQVHCYEYQQKSMDILKDAFQGLAKLKEKMMEMESYLKKHPHDPKAVADYGRLHDKYEFMGGYNTKEKLQRMIHGLKIPQSVVESDFSKLSGGEKTMIMLAKALLMNPDILLLDEPTNHLDIEACAWLENYINDYKGTVIYISHDRYFLNKTAQKIIELSFHKINMYKGNYDAYLMQKKEEEERHLKLYERQQKEISRLTETARKMRSYGTEISIKRAMNLEKRIERMDEVQKPITEKSVYFSFSEQKNTSQDVIKADHISKRYESLSVFEDVSFLIRSFENVAIIGPNGSGKSTLLKLMTQELQPDKGNIRMGKGMKYAYLEQDVIFENEDKNLLEEVCDTLDMTISSARNLLGKYFFQGEEVFKKIHMLSGGERSRLRLLMEMQKSVNLLLLDEPTNHLDISSREELEEAISTFKGTMIFVSHDRHFINKFAKRVFDINQGKLEIYDGNYSNYLDKKEKQKQEEQSQTIKKPKAKGNDKGYEKRKTDARLRTLENEIKQMESQLQEIDDQMGICGSDYEKLTELGNEREILTQNIEEAYEEWMELKE